MIMIETPPGIAADFGDRAGDSVRADQAVVLRRAIRGLWTQLPTLSVAGAVVTGAAVVSIVISQLSIIGLVLVPLLVGPSAAAVCAVADDVLARDDTSLRSWWAALGRFAGFGTRTLIIAAAPATLLVLALLALQQSGSSIAYLPVIVSAIVTVVVGATMIAVLPLGVSRPGLRGRLLWLTAAHLVARWPVRFLAPICLLGLGIWACVAFTGTLLILVPAPVALLATAACWTSVLELGAAGPPRHQEVACHQDDDATSKGGATT
ncbi:hypothetical protein FOE78_04445 [Microlunatus elymi]|uniref:Uncharacterized protein n=1 Tax=Microlunatus elymi TaxID=2596828 RepID=A0A516PVR9_9ACTN|nr:hypothetical protein [Microlunatus elymi]QDP95259.1 hypothetical protein FOE78_04445 [Microlunatus elymi]